jgi:hypothetical protein
MMSNGIAPDVHKSWFMDQLHEGDKILFAAKSDKHNRCEFKLLSRQGSLHRRGVGLLSPRPTPHLSVARASWVRQWKLKFAASSR